MSGTSETEQQHTGVRIVAVDVLLGAATVAALAAVVYILSMGLAEVGRWFLSLNVTDAAQHAPLGYLDYVMYGAGSIGMFLTAVFFLGFGVVALEAVGGKVRSKFRGDGDD